MGLSNSTSFLRPITAGAVHAHGTRLHRGRTTWVWDVRFSDDAGKLCAVTRMTIAVRPLPRRAVRTRSRREVLRPDSPCPGIARSARSLDELPDGPTPAGASAGCWEGSGRSP